MQSYAFTTAAIYRVFSSPVGQLHLATAGSISHVGYYAACFVPPLLVMQNSFIVSFKQGIMFQFGLDKILPLIRHRSTSVTVGYLSTSHIPFVGKCRQSASVAISVGRCAKKCCYLCDFFCSFIARQRFY